MAIWWVNSVKYAAVPVWTASTTLAVGAFRRQTAPAVGSERVFRVNSITTGITGGSEPTWNTGKGITTTDGGVTWKEVSGDSTYNAANAWNAPHRTIDNAIAWCAAGDTIKVASEHAYAHTGSYTLSSISVIGTWNNPLKVVCVDTVTGAAATGASESATISLTVRGYLHIDGVNFTACTGGSGQMIMPNTVDDRVRLRNCTLSVASGAAPRLVLGTVSVMSDVRFDNVTLKFGNVGQTVQLANGTLRWNRGSVDPAGTIPTTLFTPQGGGDIVVKARNVDLSALGSGKTIIGGASTLDYFFSFRNCKLDPAATWAPNRASPGNSEAEFVASGNAAKTSGARKYTAWGTQSHETTIVMTGGSNDGVTAYSAKVVADADATYANPFECVQRAIWNSTLGSRTLRVEIENDGTTFKDNEIILDVEYPADAASPLGGLATSDPGPMAAGANLPTSTATWTTTGHASPVKQYIAVTFTPALAGYVYYRVKVAKASATVFIDQKAALS